MKRLAVLPLAAAMLMATAPAVLARADSYYTVICDGVAYESVDAHAIDQGHKWDAIQNFMNNTPFGMSCTLSVKVTP